MIRSIFAPEPTQSFSVAEMNWVPHANLDSRHNRRRGRVRSPASGNVHPRRDTRARGRRRPPTRRVRVTVEWGRTQYETDTNSRVRGGERRPFRWAVRLSIRLRRRSNDRILSPSWRCCRRTLDEDDRLRRCTWRRRGFRRPMRRASVCALCSSLRSVSDPCKQYSCKADNSLTWWIRAHNNG